MCVWGGGGGDKKIPQTEIGSIVKVGTFVSKVTVESVSWKSKELLEKKGRKEQIDYLISSRSASRQGGK